MTIKLKVISLSVLILSIFAFLTQNAYADVVNNGDVVRIKANAWKERNGYYLVPHRNWYGIITKSTKINKTSSSTYEYRVQYANGQHNDHVLDQDVSLININQAKYQIGQSVRINNNAWAESNGYRMTNHRNWVGTVVSRRSIIRKSYSNYEYYIRYSNGQHNDHVLEQDLNVGALAQATVSASDIGRQINWTTPNVDISVYNFKTNTTTRYTKGNLDLNYTASMIKIAILTQLMHEHPNLTVSQKKLAVKMITQSNNDAATALSGQIGRDAGMRSLFNGLGMSQSFASGVNRWGLTSTNSSDYMKLMKVIFGNSSYISTNNRQYIQYLMNSVDKNQRWGLPKNVSSNTALYVKDGWLPLGKNNTNAVINSASRVKNFKSDYLVVQISNEDRTQNDGFNMLNRVGQTVYNVLNK